MQQEAHSKLEDKNLIRRYLLGGLAESEQERLERRCLTDDGFSQAVDAAENDLIDAYVCKELSADERQQFEDRYLDSPERRARLEIAIMLMSPAVRNKVSSGPMEELRSKLTFSWWQRPITGQFGFAAAALVMTALAIFFIAGNWRLRTDLERSRSARLELQNQIEKLQKATTPTAPAVQAKLEPLHSPPVPAVSIMLSPGLLRSGGDLQNRLLKLPAGDSMAILMLRLEAPITGTAADSQSRYSRFDVVVQSVEGTQLKRFEGLTSQPIPGGGRMVPAHIPSQLLSDGDYLVTLSGRSTSGGRKELASYSFSVIR